MKVMVEHTCREVENISVDLTKRHNQLEWMAERMVYCDEVGKDEGKWSPANLFHLISVTHPRTKRIVTRQAVGISPQ